MEEARSRRPSYSQANCIRPIQLPKMYFKVQTYVFMYLYFYVCLHQGGRGPSQAELSYSQAKIHCIKPIRIKIFFFCKSLILCRNRNETVDSFVAQKSRSFSASQSYKCKIFIKHKASSCFYLLNYLLKYRTQYIYFHRGRAQGFIVH